MLMLRSRISVVLLAVIALLLVGCSDLAYIELDYDSYTVLEPNQVVSLTAVGKTGVNTNADLETVVWSINDQSLATIEGDGVTAKLTTIAEGELVVTATSGDATGSVSFTIMSALPDPIVLQESFEGYELGSFPEGWIIANQEAHELNNYSGGRVSNERKSAGDKALKLVSIPGARGRVEFEFDQPLLNNSLTVDIFQPSDTRDDINIELLSDEGRVFGVFITGSGNVRYRHPDGSNGSNITNIPNDGWHTIEFQWNDEQKTYRAYAISAGSRTEITPPGGSSYETQYIDGQVTKLGIAVTDRDADRIGYIDNIEVIDLAAQELLGK